MRVLIAIHGAHCQPEHMAAQRETWLHDLPGADYRFFLGQPAGSEPDVVYGDFADGPIRAGGYGWHTGVVSDKTELLVRYALEHEYDYAFKCDDDTYVRVQRLLNSGFEAHDYSGFTEAHSADGLGQYRWCQGGAGYWLSHRSMEIIAVNGLRLHRSEDYAVGQLLARNGIAPHHDDRYIPQVKDLENENRPSFLTLHKVNPTQMRRLYEHDVERRIRLACPKLSIDMSLCEEFWETAEQAIESGEMTEEEASRTLLGFVRIQMGEDSDAR